MTNKTFTHDEFLAIEQKFHDNYAKHLNWDKPITNRISYETKNVSSIEIEKYFFKLLGNIKDKKILDIGSGFGNLALFLAKNGAIVTSIDISQELIKGCRYRAKKNKLDVAFYVMDAEDLKFNAHTFDIIVGTRTLHHLQNIDKFIRNAYRCLKKDGFILFVEPQKYNPFVEFGRKFINNNYKKHRTLTEHPLTPKDIKLIKKTFGNIEKYEFQFLSASCQFFRLLGWKNVYIMSDYFFMVIDKILWHLPFLRPMYWQVLIKCYKKQDNAQWHLKRYKE